MSRAKTFAGVGALALVLALAATAALRSYGAGDPQATPTEPAAAELQDPLLGARTIGAPNAPVTVYELSDFQCPYCRTFWEETLPALKEEYIARGQVRLVFINFPLASIHPNAPAAHEFAMCAALQGQFWPVHDLLYQHQEKWEHLEDPATFFLSLADSVELILRDLGQCLATGAMRPVVTADMRMAARGGVRSTPTFVIEGIALQGAAPIDTWRPLLDSLITLKQGG